MQGYWSVHATSSTAFSVLDVDSAATSSDPYASLKSQFALAKDLIGASAVVQGATDGGAAAIADAYHATLVAPFCLAAVRDFFAAL
jgi:hypothetical protein